MSGSRVEQAGVTLVGLLVALGVLAILAGLAMPAWQGQVARHRLIAGLTAVRGALVQARHEAIFLNRRLIFVFRPETRGDGWCFAVTDDPDCNCHAGDCPVPSGARRPVRSLDFPELDLRVLPGNGAIRFYPARGTSSAGSVELSIGDVVARVIVSSLGRIRVCSSSIPGYPRCR